jgi:hypothetical protein
MARTALGVRMNAYNYILSERYEVRRFWDVLPYWLW